jgi:hypothetical protein
MNKDKILKNPLVVVALSLAAVSFIIVNNVLPLISKKPDVISETQEMVPTPIQNVSLSEPVLNQGMETLDSIKKNSLQTVGWKRSGGRDPFLNEKRLSTSDVEEKIEVGLGSSYQSGKRHDKLTLKKPVQPVKKLLQAISVGKTEKVVLIGTRMYHEGDTCNLGIIKRIGADSVLIHGPGGVRILQF